MSRAPRFAPAPMWLRAALAALCAALLLLAATAVQAPKYAGSWGNETTFSGRLGPGEIDSYPFFVRTPAEFHGRGLNFDIGSVGLSLRVGYPLNGTTFRATVQSEAGENILDVLLDPANPLSAPYGPPVALVQHGSFVLYISALNTTTNYTVHVATVFPFSASRVGATLDPLVLGGLGVGAAVLAVLPLPPRGAVRRGRREDSAPSTDSGTPPPPVQPANPEEPRAP